MTKRIFYVAPFKKALKPGHGKSFVAQIVIKRKMTPREFWRFIARVI